MLKVSCLSHCRFSGMNAAAAAARPLPSRRPSSFQLSHRVGLLGGATPAAPSPLPLGRPSFTQAQIRPVTHSPDQLPSPSPPTETQVGSSAGLCTVHPAFGEKVAPSPVLPRKKALLSTHHPAFGDAEPVPAVDADKFQGPVAVSGFFFAVDPHLSAHGFTSRVDEMNPNAQLTIRDAHGRASRARYACRLRASGGFKIEALVRCQLGWIAPKCTFKELPYKIQLGSGFDVSIPFIAHFTAVRILDEHGRNTGSCLFLSGTPMIGLSCGIVRIVGGDITHDPTSPIDPDREAAHFVCGMHYRQFGFLAFKSMGYVVCAIAACLNLVECKDAILASLCQQQSTGAAL